MRRRLYLVDWEDGEKANAAIERAMSDTGAAWSRMPWLSGHGIWRGDIALDPDQMERWQEIAQARTIQLICVCGAHPF